MEDIGCGLCRRVRCRKVDHPKSAFYAVACGVDFVSGQISFVAMIPEKTNGEKGAG